MTVDYLGHLEVIGYDVMMMSQLAREAQVNSPLLAYSDGYVVRLYFASPDIMSAHSRPHVTEYVRLPPGWEYT